MSASNDRVGEFFYKYKHRRKTIVTPEGIPLDVWVAGNVERLIALSIDMFVISSAIVVLVILAVIIGYRGYGSGSALSMTLIILIFFLIRNFYFVHFELKWQGRTPGKKICGLRVINRDGGELSASAVLARNFTREVEVFIPLSILLILGASGPSWQLFTSFGWILVMALMPLFNKEHLRIGDIIGGTQVIAMPKRTLLGDLAVRQRARFTFTPEQLSKYGAFELQVLEELLRKPQEGSDTEKTLREVAEAICRKIQWPEDLKNSEVRAFLNDFYAAERAELERERLFGRYKEDKFQN